MLVIAGSGHVNYGWGIPERVQTLLRKQQQDEKRTDVATLKDIIITTVSADDSHALVKEKKTGWFVGEVDEGKERFAGDLMLVLPEEDEEEDGQA